MDDEVMQLLTCYLKGLNTFIESKVQKLPVEFGMMRIKPAKWTINDILSFSRLMSWQMSFCLAGRIGQSEAGRKGRSGIGRGDQTLSIPQVIQSVFLKELK